jgi:1,4-dihydroxy-2-naphthoate octaprenyltransferase
VFFGLVAVLGTTYTQADRITWPAVLGAVGVGLIACALLMVNNLRDIPTDVLAGKRTLAVRLGDHKARRAYVAMLWAPVLLGVVCAFWAPWSLVVLLLFGPAILLTIPVLAGARGKLLIPVLAGTGLYELGYGLLLWLGLSI